MTDEEKFYPISELKKYKNKCIKEIDIIYDNQDFNHFNSLFYDFVETDEKGNFYLSDYNFGLIIYDEKEKSYFHHYLGSATKINIIGYSNLVLAN